MYLKSIAIAVLSGVLGASVGLAQTAAPANQSKVFDFSNKPTQQGLQEIATILRTVGNIKQLSIDSASSSLTVTGTPDELAMFKAVKRTDIYGDDDAAALRDLLFSWWEERFLHAHAGAPSIENP